MEDTKIYTGCYHCNDFFEITDEVLGISNGCDLIKCAWLSIKWWSEDKICLKCGNKYNPNKLSMKTYPFVFEAFRRTKTS